MSTAARKARKRAGEKFEHKKVDLSKASNWSNSSDIEEFAERSLIVDGVTYYKYKSTSYLRALVESIVKKKRRARKL